MNFRESRHFQYRAQQRSMNKVVLICLMKYGKSQNTRNKCEKIYFDKAALSEIYADSPDTYRILEKHKNSYIVVSDDGCLVTAVRSY